MSTGNEIILQLLKLRGLAFRCYPDRTSEYNYVYRLWELRRSSIDPLHK